MTHRTDLPTALVLSVVMCLDERGFYRRVRYRIECQDFDGHAATYEALEAVGVPFWVVVVGRIDAQCK